jgi:hypothetical protein
MEETYEFPLTREEITVVGMAAYIMILCAGNNEPQTLRNNEVAQSLYERAVALETSIRESESN